MKSEDFDQNEWPESPPARVCSVCCAPSNGYHFNAPSCSACAAFFRRTVTLDRRFSCPYTNICKVEYTMRVICRACRYSKCINAGMDRKAVQPRRDSNVPRRKVALQPKRRADGLGRDPLAAVMESSGLGSPPLPPPPPPPPPPARFAPPLSTPLQMPMNGHAPLSSAQHSQKAHSIQWSPSFSPSFPSPPVDSLEAVEDLLREERLHNERRKILYCGRSPISTLLAAGEINDIPFCADDLSVLTFAAIQKDIRPQILLIYEWIRGWRHTNSMSLNEKKTFLRRCILYHTILDPAYLTYKLGYPDRFVMFNGLFVGVDRSSTEGWEDENGVISSQLKQELYRPLMERVVNEIVGPMQQIQLSYTEFVVLKGLISFKGASVYDMEPRTKELMNQQIDAILCGLNAHYAQLGMSTQEVAERTGNIILLMSSLFAVSMECLESHQKIQFFDLWELDDLLLQLLTRSAPKPRTRTSSMKSCSSPLSGASAAGSAASTTSTAFSTSSTSPMSTSSRASSSHSLSTDGCVETALVNPVCDQNASSGGNPQFEYSDSGFITTNQASSADESSRSEKFDTKPSCSAQADVEPSVSPQEGRSAQESSLGYTGMEGGSGGRNDFPATGCGGNGRRTYYDATFFGERTQFDENHPSSSECSPLLRQNPFLSSTMSDTPTASPAFPSFSSPASFYALSPLNLPTGSQGSLHFPIFDQSPRRFETALHGIM